MHLPSPFDTNRGPRLPRIPTHGRVPQIHLSSEEQRRAQFRKDLVYFVLAVYLVMLCVGAGYLLAWAYPKGLGQ